MYSILEAIEKELPSLLNQPDIWKSVFVDYHLPYVKRLWTKFQYDGTEYRIYLHKILPCELEQCLFHPHPWPSIMKIITGQYKMQLGYGTGMMEPPVASTLTLPSNTIYEMIEPNAWHAVSPIKNPSYSIMVTGTPWDRPSHKSTKTLNPLSLEEEKEILEFFQDYYQK
jgi:phenylpropionate dioxygenase-like ring-hydroxylating dioxygenase large terminal subunit